MSEVRLVIRDASGDWSGTIHGSVAERAVAALSADPATLDELEAGMVRFAKGFPAARMLSNLRPGLRAEPYDAGLVVIDLVARMVVVDSTYFFPAREGTVCYHDGRSCTQTALRFHLAEDWLLSSEGLDWEGVAEVRRRERAAIPARDLRDALYGRPMLEFVGRECFAAFARSDEIAAAVRAQRIEAARNRLAGDGQRLSAEAAGSLTDEQLAPQTWPGQELYANPFYDTLKEIHAAWLLTPRDDLGGARPREKALERRDHLGWDLQDRSEQWSRMGECPPGIAETSHAFRYGGFGTHELVVYYHLVRTMLWSCWDRLAELSQLPTVGQRPESMAVGDFLATEVLRLERLREAWLDAPDREYHGRTPRAIATRERARLPEGISGREAMVDPDCPCCQMLGDMPGTGFWHLDGSGMDDGFAFDIYQRTREGWEEERREWEEFNRRFDAERAECKLLGVTSRAPGEDGSNAVWTRSFTVGTAADLPLGIRAFGIGCKLAELIVGLRSGADRETTAPDAQSSIDRLNRDFGNFREILQSADASVGEALIEPVRDRFCESLEAVADARPELASQCQSLGNELGNLLNPPPDEPFWDADDPDVPY